MECRGRHGERTKNRAVEKRIEGHPRRHLDDAAEHIDRESVVECGPRLEHQRQPRDAVRELGERPSIAQFVGPVVDRVDRGISEHAVGQPGRVGEQIGESFG
jgi:hypothetical protein